MAETLWILGICLLLGGVRETLAVTSVDIPMKTYKIARGDNVTIPCTYSPPGSTSTPIITWTASPDVPGEPSVDVISFLGKVKVSRKYKGRVNLLYDFATGKADLQLISVTSADTRVYECKVQFMEDEEDSLSDTANLVVLVAPSTPKCTIEGKAEYFEDIKMTCKSDEGTPAPAYKWQIYDVNNNPRPNPLKATDQNGVLSIYNISKDASGYYICTSTNEIRSAKCNVTLAVMPPSMNMASTAGIIGAAAGAVLLLVIIIVICCCCRRRRNDKSEEYSMGTPEGGEYTDKDPEKKGEEYINSEEERRVKSADRRDPQDDRSERSYDRRSDFNDRRDQNTDRRDDRDDRYDDRHDRYNDRRDRYDDRCDRYEDRREQHDDRRDRYDDRQDRYDDRREHYDDRRDRYDDRYDSDRYSDYRDRPPSVPPNKPKEQRN